MGFDKQTEPLVPGQEINLGGQVLTVPPLNFFAIRTEAEKIVKDVNALQAKGGVDVWNPEHREKLGQLILLALKRNYPQATWEDLEPLLDLSNFMPTYLTVMGLSGFMSGELKPGSQPVL